ncbi:MAG: DNA polymerase II large subunit, partial [Halobacteriaceae archaeon]
ILQNDDGSEFVNVYYAGPIRSAGGTAQALSVLVADYTRALLGIAKYDAYPDEIERYAEEVALYDQETGLQYAPSDEETKFITRNIPIMLDGEATGEEEVSGFRDLERVDTNNARGGLCLVLAEGIAQKAPKIQRYTRDIDEIEWPWLQDLIDGEYRGSDTQDQGIDNDSPNPGDDEPSSTDEKGSAGPPSSSKYLKDLIAGRPVFGHPSTEGGFRLRYGRARNHGFATAGIHPATMHLVDDFLATGTQLKTERPGKAAGVVPVDSIEGPTVKLANGDVKHIDDPEEAVAIRNGVEEIIDLGEYLVNYGEFVENNHPLVPSPYVVEWWVKDMDSAGADVQAMQDSPHVDIADPGTEKALEWAEEYDAPLHPNYTYLWHDISTSDFEYIAAIVTEGSIDTGELVIDGTNRVQDILESLLIEHHQGQEITIPEWRPFVQSLGLTLDLECKWDELPAEAKSWQDGESAIKAVNAVSPFEVRERAPTRIGNRMGRPEKSERRDLSPAVHSLFPIGDAGGSQRKIPKAAEEGQLQLEVGTRYCQSCDVETFQTRCPECNSRTSQSFECPDC